jgi:hypothetical protein
MEVRASSTVQTHVDRQSVVTVLLDKISQVITRLTFISKLPW